MYAIVKTGGKQYKVAAGDIIEIEKVDAEVGSTIQLDVICVVDGSAVEADPAKAGATTVTAEVLEQFKGDKQLVFKFKKRKNYKRTKGHRQQLTRVKIEAIGGEKAPKKAAAKKDTEETAEKKAPKKDEAKKAEAVVEEQVEAVEKAEEAAVETVEEVTAADSEAAAEE